MFSELDPTIAAAIISTVISLFVSGVVAFFQLRKTQRRAATQKLIDLRLEHYPRGFELAGKIRKVKGNTYDPKKLNSIKNELFNWRNGIAGMILSKPTYKCLRRLRDALTIHGEKCTPEQVEKIEKYRSEFRGNLRMDIGVLHREDENAMGKIAEYFES